MSLFRSVLLVFASSAIFASAFGAGLEGDSIHLEARYRWNGALLAEADAIVGAGVELSFDTSRLLDIETYQFTYDVDVSADKISIAVDTCWQGAFGPPGCIVTDPGSGQTMTVFPNEIDLVLSGLDFDGGALAAVTVTRDEYVSTNPQIGGVNVQRDSHQVSVHFPLFFDGQGEWPMEAGVHEVEIQLEGAYPWSNASVRQAGSHRGNGVVVADRWVLTSAVVGAEIVGGGGSVEVGTCVRGQGSVVGVQSVWLYNPGLPPFRDDVALLELSDSVSAVDPTVSPAAIASPAFDYAGSVAQMIGWWTQSCNSVLPMNCTEQFMPVISNAEAATRWSGVSGANILDQHLAIFDDVQTVNNGGNGTGVFVDGEVVALVSWGVSNCSPSYPKVCQRLTDEIVDWIQCTIDPGQVGCAKGCSPCGCAMTLSSYGGIPDVVNGNLNFGLQIENAPETFPGLPLTGLLMASGPLASSGGTPFACGSFYLPASVFRWTQSTPPTGGGSCGWTQRYPVGIPTYPSLKGLTLSAQGYALCYSTLGLSLTNGIQFTLQ